MKRTLTLTGPELLALALALAETVELAEGIDRADPGRYSPRFKAVLALARQALAILAERQEIKPTGRDCDAREDYRWRGL